MTDDHYNSGFPSEEQPVKKTGPRLCDDVLRLIFALNGHADYCYIGFGDKGGNFKQQTKAEAALIVTRRSSQVCRQWRGLLLKSPTIWATSLDLQYLDQVSDEWRDEILKRTGNSLLTVVGDFVEKRPSAKMFTILLVDHWTRIRRLFVRDYTDGLELHSALRRPAPNLEFLYLVDYGTYRRLNTLNGTPWFADRAPQLRGVGISTLATRPSCSWFTNIRHIWNWMIDYNHFPASEVLGSLKLFPSLETLCLTVIGPLNDAHVDMEKSSLPIVHMPNLRKLSMAGTISAIIPVLQHVVPSRNCSIHLYISFLDIGGYFEPVQDFGNSLATFLRRCSHQDFGDLYYEFTDGKFHMFDSTGLIDLLFENRTPGFENSWEDVSCHVLAALKPHSRFLSISKLFLTLHIRPMCQASLVDFLKFFTCVEVLDTDLRTIQILNELHVFVDFERLDAALFPAMTELVVQLDDRDPQDSMLHPESKVLHQYIAFRHEIGVPIKTLLLKSFHRRKRKATPSWRVLAKNLGFILQFTP